ncbi:MAG: glycosyltransferase family 4 protein [Pseudomonadota bacterium]
MKLWVIEIGEPLPVESDVRLLRYGEITKALSKYGHDVIWWTSGFSHAAKRHVCDRDRDIMMDGVMLRMVKGPGYGRNISWQRVRHQKHFAARFRILAEGCDLPEVIICTVPTIETAKTAVEFADRHNIPILIDIRDEWPDEFVDLAPKPFRKLVRLILYSYFKDMEYICRNATGIIAVSKSFLEYGISFANRKIGLNDGVFPLGYSAQFIAPEKMTDAKVWWQKQGVDGSAFTCCFLGTIGKFFNLETVIRAAKILSKEMDIQFVMCGSGSSLERYKREAAGIESVVFPGWVDAPKIAALMGMADVGLAPYAANTRMSLPNKPFEYFSGGLPVVSSIQGELKQILAEHCCGITYDPDSVSGLCDCLRKLNNDKKLYESMSRNASRLYRERYSMKHISKAYHEHLVNVVHNFRNIRRQCNEK